MSNINKTKINISKKYIMYIIYALIISTYLIGASKIYRNLSDIKYILILLYIIISLIFLKFKLPNNKLTNEIFILLTIFITIPPILNILILRVNTNIYINISLHLILIIFFYLVSVDKNDVNKYILITFIISSFYLIIIFLINDGINTLNPSNIKYALSSDLDFRKRQTYGLYHVNALGNLCFIIIISGIYLVKNFEYKKKINKYITILMALFVNYILILSGSRGAITSIILFLIVYCMVKFLTKNYKSLQLKLVSIIILLLISFILVMSFVDIAMIDSLIEYMNRFKYWADTIDYMKSLNPIHMLIGLGFYSPGYLFNSSIYTPPITDNSFLYTFMILGFFGVVLLLCVVILIFIKLTKYLLLNRDNKSIYFFTFFIIYIYYCNIETILFMPDQMSSLVFWVYILTYINSMKK